MDASPPIPPPHGSAWRIAIVDDYSIMRAVFTSLMEDHRGLEVVWSASSLAEARLNLWRDIPDMLIVDVSLPDGEGYELIGEALAVQPVPRVLVISNHAGREYAQRALDCGAKGYLTKNSSPGDIIEAIALIQRGGTCFKTLGKPHG
jgi:DNA-binding NarL/FixJ family response regulator